MDEGERRFDVGVGQVWVVGAHLRGAQQALVDDGLGRHARDRELGVGDAGGVDGLLDATADHVELALEGVERAVAALDDQLADERRCLAGEGTDRLGDDGDLAPADGAMTLFGNDAYGDLGATQARTGVVGEEDHADAVVAGGRQVDALLAGDPRQEAVRHLDENAGAVTGLGIGTGGATVVETLEDGQRLIHHRVRGHAVEVHDRAEATGVVLEPLVVETAAVVGLAHCRNSNRSGVADGSAAEST